jgi:hypothetical protein
MNAAIKQEMTYLTTNQALDKCEAVGMGMNLVTLIKIAREKGFLHQPAGKHGKCWLEEGSFDEFLRTGG